MPTFREKPSHFDVKLDHEGEEFSIKVRWTPEADDEFARSYGDTGEGRLAIDQGAAYDLLLRQAVDWENVYGEATDGKQPEPLPYSPENLRRLFTAGLKIRLIQRFIGAVLTYTEATTGNPP